MKNLKKIVIKVGSSLLTAGKTTIVPESLERVVRLVARLQSEGKEVILVTSGAIACGLSVLGLEKKPKELDLLQAAAAAGQNVLMQAYAAEFAKHKLKCAQVLLTKEDFYDRQRYFNASNTIKALLKFKIVPVVNENDAVSVDEIKFGDNDTLSASVAIAIEAEGLLILTDIDGLYESFEPKTKSGRLIKIIEKISPEIEDLACGTDKDSCVGGMSTKIKAARMATASSIGVILANGIKCDELKIDFSPVGSKQDFDGTFFAPAEKGAGKKKHWIAFEAKVKGRLTVDQGAQKALVDGPNSLLSPGIIGVEGLFESGDVVEVFDSLGHVFAKGKVNFNSSDLNDVKGKRAKFEVIHRDQMVLLG